MDPADPHVRPLSVDHLQVVFKVAERCNINCTYCYYFNMGDRTAFDRPSTVSAESADRLACWLADGCRALQVKTLSLSFHGGEPMLLAPKTFAAICRSFRDRLCSVVNLSFNIQTNGTILSEEWISLFREYRVHVGVSIDGDRTAHDRYRLDHRGKSTFDKSEANLRWLVSAAGEGSEYLGPGTISVLDCRNDYKAIYEYLRGLGIRRMSFLLPDRNFDEGFGNSAESARGYGESLSQIFEAWMTEDDPGIHVRFVSDLLQDFQLRKEEAPDSGGPRPSSLAGEKKWRTQVLIAHSDGTVTVSDSYIPALGWYRKTPAHSIHSSTMSEFLRDAVFDEIEDATRSLCATCQECEWKRICRGGDLENRFSRKNGFDNPSVYCDGYQVFFRQVCDLLVANGYPAEHIRRVVGDQLEVGNCN